MSAFCVTRLVRTSAVHGYAECDMVSEAKRSKTETLSIRLDPKIRFMLEFVSKVRAQSITAVVEQSIRNASGNTVLGQEYDERGNRLHQNTWSDFWDPSEGVRTLKLISDQDYSTNFDEDELRQFTLTHWEFFYYSHHGTEPRRVYIDIFWPRIGHYLQIWKKSSSINYWASGKAMAQALLAAQVAAPSNWPPQTDTHSRQTDVADDLDDDIPF